jgi:hypothetical protein
MLHSSRVPNNQSLISSAEAPPAVLSDNSELNIPRGTHEAAILEDFPHEGSRNLGDVLDCQQLAIPHASGPPVHSSCDTLVKRVTRKGRRRKNKSKKKERRKKRLRKTEGGKQGRGRTLLYRRFVKRRRQQQRRMRVGKKSTCCASESGGDPVEREQIRRRRLGRAKLRQLWLQSQKYQAWRRDQSRQQLLEQPGAQLAIQQLWQGLFRQGNQWQQVYQVKNSWLYSSFRRGSFARATSGNRSIR